MLTFNFSTIKLIVTNRRVNFVLSTWNIGAVETPNTTLLHREHAVCYHIVLAK